MAEPVHGQPAQGVMARILEITPAMQAIDILYLQTPDPAVFTLKARVLALYLSPLG